MQYEAESAAGAVDLFEGLFVAPVSQLVWPELEATKVRTGYSCIIKSRITFVILNFIELVIVVLKFIAQLFC